MKTYIVSKEACQAAIDQAGDVCCRRCGGDMTPIELEYADAPGEYVFRAGCEPCQNIPVPIERRLYKAAKWLFKNTTNRRYNDPRPQNEEFIKEWEQSEISGLCYLVEDVLYAIEKNK